MLKLSIRDVNPTTVKTYVKLPRMLLIAALLLMLLVMLPLGFQVVRLASDSNSIMVNTGEDEDNNDGDCSLREAIRAANMDRPVDACRPGNGADNVVLPHGKYQVSAQRPLEIWSDLTISGAGVGKTIIEVDALPDINIAKAFRIADVNVSVSGLSIYRRGEWDRLGISD